MNKDFPCYLGLDQGSSSSKCALIDSDGDVKFSDQIAVGTNSPDPGIFEQDGEQLFKSLLELYKRAKDFSTTNNIVIQGVGFSIQRSGVLAWDKSGNPVTPVLTWRDSRVRNKTEKLLSNSDDIYRISGLPLTYHYAASKIALLQKEYPECFVGTLDSFFIYKLSKASMFITEESHASRSQLYDPSLRCWSSKLCELFGVDVSRLAKVVPSFYKYPQIDNVPVTSVLGDQQAALFPFYNIDNNKKAVLNIGTVASLQFPRGRTFKFVKGFLSGVSYSINEDTKSNKSSVYYQSEASINVSAPTFERIFSHNKVLKNIADIDGLLADYIPATDDAVSMFTYSDKISSGSPFWRNDLKNCYTKVPKNDTEHMYSLIENLAFWIYYNYQKISTEMGNGNSGYDQIVVTGGGSEVKMIDDILASLTEKPVSKMPNSSASAIGAATAAAYGLGDRNVVGKCMPDVSLATHKYIRGDEFNRIIHERYTIWQEILESILLNDYSKVCLATDYN